MRCVNKGNKQAALERHPGILFKSWYLEPLKVTTGEAAAAMKITRQTLSELINGHAGITAEMAIRISNVFGGTPETWMLLQAQYELENAKKKLSIVEFERIM